MTAPTRHQIAAYLTDSALGELVKYVMEDTGCSLEQALDRVYDSPLLSALQDEETELYVQSPAYLYELLNFPSAAPFAPSPSFVPSPDGSLSARRPSLPPASCP